MTLQQPGSSRAHSLTLRLILSSALVALILLVTAGLLLSSLFQQALERNFDARLQAVLDGLPANLELGTDAQPALIAAISDTRFTLPWSGWYWQVTPASSTMPNGGIASDSLLGERLRVSDALLMKRDEDGIAHIDLTDAKGQKIRALEQQLQLFGSPAKYSILVAGNFDELKAEVTAFRRALYIVLTVLGLGLILGLLIQIRMAIRPLKKMRDSLAAIRSGEAEQLQGLFPREIKPVADELNMLIQANTEIVERARAHVGNLAHALKTPLSVLTNEAGDAVDVSSVTVLRQTEVMRDQISLYLDRARRAARAQTKGSITDVGPVLHSLARTISRINRDRNIEIDVETAVALKFRGESQDLEEMAGNLIDNAAKWATHHVYVKASLANTPDETGRDWLLISIADDGPGLPAGAWVEALKRGKRLDETKPGSGLGLAIVSETAGMYGGTLAMQKAVQGGLDVVLKLPAA